MKIRNLLIVLLAAALALGGLCAAAETEERAIGTAADADEWIRLFLGERPEALDSGWKMTKQMKLGAKMAGGMRGLAKSLDALGTVVAVGAAREDSVKGYQVFYIPCVFSAARVDLILTVDRGAVAGLSTGAYTGEGEEQASDAFDSVALALPVPSLNGELPGTLLVPKGEGPFPAAVLVQGSGPSDRDESVGALKPFRDLAEGLAERGVAVYRFDKRTYVYSEEMAANRQGTLVDESIEDAVNAVQLLAKQEKIDPARIFVLGHSLGGNAVPAVDQALRTQPVSACGYILMAASTRPMGELMRMQYEFLYSLAPELTPEQQAEKDTVFSELDRLRDVDALNDDDMVMGVYAPYWKWLAAYDVAGMARMIEKPCLLLQGEEDYQVTMEDFALWQAALDGRENWRLISYPGLTHPFTEGLKSEGSAVYARDGRMDARVIADIADFIVRTDP